MITLTPKELALVAVQGFGAMQKVSEFASLLELLEKEVEHEYRLPLRILEIGAGKGGTAWAFTKLRASKVVSIDLPNGPWGGGEIVPQVKYINENSKCEYHYIAGNSQSPEAFLKAQELIPVVDFLFIDGDHSYEGVKADYEKYEPLVRQGGIIGFHDIALHAKETGCEVEKFWCELIKGRQTEACIRVLQRMKEGELLGEGEDEYGKHLEYKLSLKTDGYDRFIEDDGNAWAGIGVIRK